ncbi:MAG: UPF0158 family protein [Bryobacteraceae bacterium]
MAATVLLSDIVDALEMQIDEAYSFLDLDTGVETVSSDLLRDAEEDTGEDPDLPDWQKEEWDIARRIVSTDRFLKLPSKFDVHEWEIMHDFSLSVTSERIREDLLGAIHGKDAFRYFKDTVRRHRIESDWFTFRADALGQTAIDWCEEHDLAWQKVGQRFRIL